MRVSKWLARHLRHDPGRVGLALDPAGWAEVEAVIAAASATGFPISLEELAEVVAGNDKRRYELDREGRRIRACQGHTVAVDLGLAPAHPPGLLYHGTVERHLPAILSEGLRPMGRHHVHLSADVTTALAVGRRRGRPVVLQVDAAAMVAAGRRFLRSANGVWLTDDVPPAFLARH